MRKSFTLNHYFQDHMIFQADKPIKIFGKCKKHIDITVNFLDQEKTIRTTDTYFEIELAPESYLNKAFSFSISCRKQKTIIYHCMIGDIYLFLGGKNLAKTLYDSHIVKDYDNEDLRLYDFVNGQSWRVSSRDELSHVSVLAYLFAKHLRLLRKVPIGIILYADENETIFSWLNQEMVLSNIDMKNYLNGVYQQKWIHLSENYKKAHHLFSRIGIASLVVHQGENDFNHFHFYEKALRSLITTYRLIFQSVTLPVYLLQLPSFRGKCAEKVEASEIRIAQSVVADNKKHIYVVSDIDMDEDHVISLKKKVLAKRLVNCVLEKQYKKGKNSLCPQLFSYTVRDNLLSIYTHQNYLSMISRSGKKLGFYAVDQKLRLMKLNDIAINNNQIVIKIKPSFVEIRYAYDNNPVCDIFASNGLPLLPFKVVLK